MPRCISEESIRSKTSFVTLFSPILQCFALFKVLCAAIVNHYRGLVGGEGRLAPDLFVCSDHFLIALSWFCRHEKFVRQPAQPAGPGLEVGHLPGPTHCTNLRRPYLPGPLVSQSQPQPAGGAVPE